MQLKCSSIFCTPGPKGRSINNAEINYQKHNLREVSDVVGKLANYPVESHTGSYLSHTVTIGSKKQIGYRLIVETMWMLQPSKVL